jgi:hypothetical protein
MPQKQNRFNKKILAILIDKAKGDRSLRQFALDCDISYMQLRKLSLCVQENPPRRKLLQKLAQNSFNGIELEDFLFSAGTNEEEPAKHPEKHVSKKHDIQSVYEKLSLRQKKTVEDFIDFLRNCKSGI